MVVWRDTLWLTFDTLLLILSQLRASFAVCKSPSNPLWCEGGVGEGSRHTSQDTVVMGGRGSRHTIN